MPPILLCLSMKLEVNVDVMVVEVEPSYKYSAAFCWSAMDGSGGAV